VLSKNLNFGILFFGIFLLPPKTFFQLPATASPPAHSQRYVSTGPVIIMRGSALRNGARPANSMEQVL
jgi:hypothetical protein